MSLQDWTAFALSITSLIGAFAVMVRWMVKHYLTELKPNGGGSMRDAVNVNTERLNRVESRVDDIYKLLCEK